MKRTIVSKEDLLNWMNSQLAENEECANCRFTSIFQLREEDEHGCNWSPHTLRCSGVSAQACKQIAEAITVQAMKRFNVKWP